MPIPDSMSIAKRTLIPMIGTLILVLATTFLGWRSMQRMTNELETVYLRNAVPMVDLSQVASKLDAVYADLLSAFQHGPGGQGTRLARHPVSEHTERIGRIVKKTDALWGKYMASPFAEGVAA